MTQSKEFNGKLLLVITLQAICMSWIALWNSPVCDEVGHLTAGLYIWETGHVTVYPVNPPLVKLIASLPAAVLDPQTDWNSVASVQALRPEFEIGKQFIRINGQDSYLYHTYGRLCCIPFTLLGTFICYKWSRELYGDTAGCFSAICWAISPTVLGWGTTFTPDVASASLGCISLYSFTCWLKNRTLSHSVYAGIFLGIALLTKLSLILLLVLFPVYWLIHNVFTSGWKSVHKNASQMIVVIALGIYLTNAGYLFQGTFRSLGSFEFVSDVLNGSSGPGIVGNSFRDTVLSGIPVPFPEDFIRGIDLQKLDFERGMSSYLFGQWSERGWWYYYIVALTLKEPVGLLVLSFLAGLHTIVKARQKKLTVDEYLLIATALITFVLISSQTGFSRYIRYTLPVFPAMFIVIGGMYCACTHYLKRIGLCALLIWSCVSSACVFPHHLSYFNELAGGPLNGYQFLLDANVDWGQDLIRLKSWLSEHAKGKSVFCAHTGFVLPTEVGVECDWIPKIAHNNDKAKRSLQLDPGLYVVSVNELFQEKSQYRYLLEYPRIATIGYSMWVYEITEP